MINWKKPELQDGEWVRPIVAASGLLGNDLTFGNLYLLRNKYDTRISLHRGFLLRYFTGHDDSLGRTGYGFPVGEGNLSEVMQDLEQDAKEHGRALQFCLVTEEQKAQLEQECPGQYRFSTKEGDSDYLYEAERLATLSGRAYHKKKNHVSQFRRAYPQARLETLTESNLEQAWEVERRWYEAHADREDDSQIVEREAIREALDSLQQLELTGAVLYVEGEPVAMTIASALNEQACDIHFEKSYGEYAARGGYAVINQMFAEELAGHYGIVWVNREEDIGIEGLRKAKQSYHPSRMLVKYTAEREA